MKTFGWIAGGILLLILFAAGSGGNRQPQYEGAWPPAAQPLPGNNHPLAPGWTPQQMPRDSHGIPILTPEHRHVEHDWLRTQPPSVQRQFQQADRLIEETQRLLDATDGY
jgi:hypothetical protein